MGKLNKTNVEKALRKSGGIVSYAAKSLNISRQYLSTWITANEMRDVLTQIDEEAKDRAEAVIMEAIADKDVSTARWFMERKGKDRGYSQKIDSTVSNPDGTNLIPTAVTKRIIDPKADGVQPDDG